MYSSFLLDKYTENCNKVKIYVNENVKKMNGDES